MYSIYCPNSQCIQHRSPQIKFFVKSGRYFRKGREEICQIYRCKSCGRRFTERIFTMNYRNRKDDLQEQVLQDVLTGSSNSSIARKYKVSETSVRNRLKQIHRYCMLWMTKKTQNIKIDEPVVFDGFESFSESQYFPLHMQHMVGKKSHFIYDFNLVPLNRKGRMTAEQRKKRQQLYDNGKKIPPELLQKKAENIFFRMIKSTEKKQVILHTDEHPAYQRAIKKLPQSGQEIHHIMTNSKIKRDVHNQLFAINALDMQLRHFLCCFKRETIAFCKKNKAVLQKSAIFYFHKNFMRPIFWKKKKNREESLISPAMKIGIENEILTFGHIQSYVDYRFTPLITEDWICA